MADLPSDTNDDAPAPVLGAPCRFLRSKGMYVYTDMGTDEAHEDDGTTVFWCQKTMKDFGPDDGLVGRQDCRDTGRPCYEPS